MLIIILLSINLTLVYAQCPEAQDDVCEDPSSGYSPDCPTTSGCNEDCGGVIVEGKCYDCGGKVNGEDDDICPEDFFNDGACITPDPDCEAVPTTTCSCSDYDNEADCNMAVCDNVNCYWDKGLFSDSCEKCFSDIICGDYGTETTCNADPCNLGNCIWDLDDEKCIESTAPPTIDCSGISSCAGYTDEYNCNYDTCDVKLQDMLCAWYSGDDINPEGCYDCYLCIIDDEELCVSNQQECEDLQDKEEEYPECDFETDCDCTTNSHIEGCEDFCSEFCDSGAFQPPDHGVPAEAYEEPPFPWYDYWELILTVLILIGYYALVHGKIVKK